MSTRRSDGRVCVSELVLGRTTITLPPQRATRPEAATAFSVGFPHDFITETTPRVFGAAAL